MGDVSTGHDAAGSADHAAARTERIASIVASVERARLRAEQMVRAAEVRSDRAEDAFLYAREAAALYAREAAAWIAGHRDQPPRRPAPR